MKLGVVFPQNESGNDPRAIREFAQAVESMGFDYLMAYDHVLGANPERDGGWTGPYTHLDTFHEVFVMFSHLAALTRTLEFVTGVLVLPQRQTALVAKQAAELAILSEGRLRLGVGIGWNTAEFEGLGEDFHTRGKRSEEQVMLLKRLWQEPLVTYHSDYHTLPDVGLNPLPNYPVPLWFGGSADVVLARMARWGDGWMPNSTRPERISELLAKLHPLLHEAGRDPADFGMDVRLSARSQPADQWADFAAEYQALGTTHLCINTMGMGFKHLLDHLPLMRQFIETLRP